jgi:hypothetical protein
VIPLLCHKRKTSELLIQLEREIGLKGSDFLF